MLVSCRADAEHEREKYRRITKLNQPTRPQKSIPLPHKAGMVIVGNRLRLNGCSIELLLATIQHPTRAASFRPWRPAEDRWRTGPPEL